MLMGLGFANWDFDINYITKLASNCSGLALSFAGNRTLFKYNRKQKRGYRTSADGLLAQGRQISNVLKYDS
jgi:hypothetical protein